MSWCWTSTGYHDYRTCKDLLLDDNRATLVDLSSMMSEPQPAWVTMTFYALTDVTGVEVVYTGVTGLIFTFVFSDGTAEEVRYTTSSM